MIKSIDAEPLLEGSPEVAEILIEGVAGRSGDGFRVNIDPGNLQIFCSWVSRCIWIERWYNFGSNYVVLWIEFPSLVGVYDLKGVSSIVAVGVGLCTCDCDCAS